MSEEAEAKPKEVEVEVPPTEERRKGIYELIQSLRGGKLDPITAILVMSEIRRMDRDEERWELERQRLTQPNPNREVDIEKLIDKINAAWEKRFAEYQSNIEKLLLKGRAEEAEAKAERLEKELKEMKEKMEHEKLLEEKIAQALTPYKEQINNIQQLLSEKTKGMSENERRSFFKSLGEQIEQNLSQEVSNTIAKRVADAIVDAFTPKEEKEVPITPEGKVDTYKMVDKWIREGLKTVQTIAQRWPQQKPPLKEVQKIPIPQTPTTPTPTETAPLQPVASEEAKPSEQPTPETKTEIPEQPKQEAKPETEEKQQTEEKQPVGAKPRRRGSTAQESPQKQEP